MLKDKRRELIEYIKENKSYLARNSEALDIFRGNLLKYIDQILQSTLSSSYYETIKHRSLPINILQRFIDKVSVVYNNPPMRTSDDPKTQEFVDFYSDYLKMNQVGQEADQYSNLFKSFAIEPYVNSKGKPCLRVLPSSTFLVYSDDLINPEEETIFMKFVSGSDDNLLIFAYSKDEFDAFYLNGADANEYLIENGGVNLYGVIPFVYGKRQKNVLLPILDSDMLAITKAIPAMLTDASGAQLYQSFSIIWGIDVKIDNPKLSPNAFWNMKSDKESDKNPQIGVIKPEADTEKIMQFIQSVFILWLETKGIKVGSVGSMDGNNSASGIAKIIDEMDAYNVVKKSAMWFEYDEQEFWNEKLPKIHNYWIKSGQINPAKFPSLMPDIDYDVTITFEKPEPMISKKELLENTKQELEMKTMTLKQAIEALHPKYTEEEINEVLDAKEVSDQNNNQSTRKPQTSGSDQVSGISN